MTSNHTIAVLNRGVPWIAATLVAMAILLGAWQLDLVEQARHAHQYRNHVVARLAAVRANLESALNARLHLVHGIAALAESRGRLGESEFMEFAGALHEPSSGVRSLQLAPGGVVSHVYPLAGNEAAIGHDLLADPARQRLVRLAIDTGQFVLAGPVELRQGGLGLIGRKPIYRLDAESRSRRFWGLAVIVLDFDDLLLAADVAAAESELDLLLRGTDATGAPGATIYGQPAVFDAEPVRLEVSLPNGRWLLAGTPAGGWPSGWEGHRLLWSVALILAILSAGFVWVLLRRPEEMRVAVAAATAELRESRSRYQLLFDQTPNAIMVLAADTLRPLEFNDKAQRILGYAREELSTLSALDWDVGRNGDALTQRIAALQSAGDLEFESMYRTRDGDLIDVWVSMRPIQVDGADAVHTVFRDISADRLNQQQLRKLSHAVEQSPSMVMVTDPDGVIDYVNPKMLQVCGYELADLVGGKPSILKSGKTSAQIYHELWRSVKLGHEWHGELLNRRKDGSEYWVSASISALTDGDGQISHFVAMQEDITDSKRDREAVAQQLRFQQTLIDALPSPVFYKDDAGVYLGCNQAFIDLIGYPREKIVGSTVYDLATSEQAEIYEQADRKLLREPRLQIYETRMQLADGGERDVVFYKAPFYRSDGRVGGLIGTLLDITDRKRTEIMLRRAAEGVSGEVGQAFFQSLARYLVGALQVDFAFVGELDRETNDQVRTLAVVAHGEVSENFVYQLENTPCANVIHQGVCLHPREVRELYPRDAMLQSMGVESYAGYPLRDSRGNTLGLLVVLNSQPLEDLDLILSLLQIFATRASAEMQRQRAEEDLRMAATVFETTSEAIMVTDSKNVIKAVNPAFSRITGYREDEAIGRNPGLLSSGRHDAKFYSGMWETLEREGHWEGEIWNRRKNGEIYPEWLSISAVRDDTGVYCDHVAVFTDITKRKHDEEKIWRQANFDALTGLPNRFLFMDRLLRALTAAKAGVEQVAVLLIDLDRLKWINDMLGHASGDRLLQHVSQRLLACVDADDTVSRWAGDEFSMIVTGADGDREAGLLVERIQTALARPFAIEQQEAFVTASIGIAVYPADGKQPESLMSNATGAMVQAKSNGGNGARRYSTEISKRAIERISLERDLHWAVERGELVLHYQPILDLACNRVVGAESLVRWVHPRRGLIGPDAFIPLAEETGLIGQIGEWVLRQASNQAAGWVASGLPPIHFSVNVSRYQFMRSNFEQQVLQALADSGVNPFNLVLEVTESTMAEDEHALIEVMHRLRKKGLRWSLDDFGTGYSSLSNLKNIPVDILKIDKSFIADVTTNADDAAVARAIVVMAKSLGLEVVAEGVATAKQHEFLCELGCEFGQGYLFSVPLAADAFKRFVQNKLRRERPQLIADREG